MSQNEQWWLNYPMPPGWEMKYDFSTKRFFYIDHATKKTSWEDPRPAFHGGPQRQKPQQGPGQATHQPHAGQGQTSQQLYPGQGQASHQQAASTLGVVAAGGGSGSNRASPRTQSPAVSRQETGDRQQQFQMMSNGQRSAEASRGRSPARSPQATRPSASYVMETSLTEADDLALLGHYEFEMAVLTQKFPAMETTKLQELLEKHHGSTSKVEDELRSVLKASQFAQEVETKAKSLRSDFPEFTLEVVKDVLKSCNLLTGQARDRLMRMRRERGREAGDEAMYESKAKGIQQDFPDADHDLIVQILRNVEGNVSDARTRLKEMGMGGDKKRRPSKDTAQDRRQKHPSPTRQAHKSEGQQQEEERMKKTLADLRAEFPDVSIREIEKILHEVNGSKDRTKLKLRAAMEDAKNKAAATARARSPASSTTTSSSKRPLSPTQVKLQVGPKRPPAKKKTAPHKRPDSAAKPKPKPSPVKVKRSPEHQPGRAHSTLAVGPNPALYLGPDDEHRIGPDGTLADGPNPDLRSGSGGLALGPNLSLRSGHNPLLNHGPAPVLSSSA